MGINRARARLAAVTLVSMIGTWAGSASAQSAYPTGPVRIVVGWPPGQTTDIVARVVAEQLSREVGQPFVVENKPGAAGIIGTEFVKNAKPDGYTLSINSTGPMAINPGLYKQ